MRIEVALKLRSPLWGRKCYACKFALVGKKLVGAKWFGKRCSNPKCQRMFKRIHIMYTPLYLKADNNQSNHPYKEFLHAMYIFGLKVPQDSMAHLIGKKRKNVAVEDMGMEDFGGFGGFGLDEEEEEDDDDDEDDDSNKDDEEENEEQEEVELEEDSDD